MAVLNILQYPDKRLHKVASAVEVVDDKIRTLVTDMAETMYAAPGIGLAAIQVDVHLEVIVMDISETRDQLRVFINPEIVKSEGELEEDFEGCLSVKDVYGKVPRYNKIRMRALNEKGQELRVKAEGFLARVLQHEVDHCNGLVFVDHIKDKKDAFYELTGDGKLMKIAYEKVNKASIFNRD